MSVTNNRRDFFCPTACSTRCSHSFSCWDRARRNPAMIYWDFHAISMQRLRRLTRSEFISITGCWSTSNTSPMDPNWLSTVRYSVTIDLPVRTEFAARTGGLKRNCRFAKPSSYVSVWKDFSSMFEQPIHRQSRTDLLCPSE